MSFLVRAWMASGIVFAVAFLAAACGGGDDGDTVASTSSPVPTSDAGVTATPPAPLPTVDPDVTLVGYESADKGYSIDYPDGWDLQPGSDEVADYFIWRTPEGRVLAQLAVGCVREEGITVDELIRRDAANVARYGFIDPSIAVPVQVDGVEGTQLTYALRLGQLDIEHMVAYAVVGDCGWRIGLNSFGAGTLDPYAPVFERIVESFRTL